jgi:Tfp pilus assembly protein PilF
MYDDAIVEFRKAINNDPKNDNTYYALGLVYLEKDDLKNAEIELQKAIQINPKNTLVFNKLKQIRRELNEIRTKNNP